MCSSPTSHPSPEKWWYVEHRGERTLLPAGLLDLGGQAVSDEPVAGLELLHRLGAVVDESEAGALAATEVCLEAEDGDIILLALVELSELGAQLVLGDVCAVGVENIAIMATVRPCRPELLPICICIPALTRPSGDVRGGGCG